METSSGRSSLLLKARSWGELSRVVSLDLLIRKVVEAYNQKVFRPHLEADWVGYLYHLAVNELPDWEVHLSARVCGHSIDEKFDFVVGQASKTLDGRPCVQPSLVAEIKCFVKGFTPQQNQVHLGEVLDRDLPKLHSLSGLKLELNKYLVLFDEVDYLQG